MRPVPASLTGRLVVTVITLVAVVAFLVAAVTALAMRSYLGSRLDQQVAGASERASRDYRGSGSVTPPIPGHDGDEGPRSDPAEEADEGPPVGEARGQGIGTVTAVFDSYGNRGNLLAENGSFQRLSRAELDVLHDVPADREV